MAIRVMQLAKELGYSTAEMLEKLQSIDIAVKSGPMPLNAEQEKLAREKFGKPEKEEKKKEEKKQPEKKASSRATAALAEKQKRAKERAVRGDYDGLLGADVKVAPPEKKEEKKPEPKKVTVKHVKAIVEKSDELSQLLEKVEDEKERLDIEKKIAANKKKLEAAAKAVAKQQKVEEALKGKKASKKEEDKPKKVISAKTKKSEKLGLLLDQISHEEERMKDEGVTYIPSKKRKKQKGKFEPNVPELETVSEEDRYAQMAAAAEKLQRDKVLEEARAAVAAASQEGSGRRKKRKEKREAEAREKAELEAIEKGLDPDLVFDETVAEIPEGATVGEFAEALNVPPNDVIKRLFMLGQALTLTQTMSSDLIELIADDMERKIRIVNPEEDFNVVYNDTEKDLKDRPPVVTVMGHVDHGKTSLLDAIRDTAVIESESGGITQHIGASVVFKNDRQITFIDTPGHEAFTAMRARGAEITDVIVLVVAADDGVMPQTKEAINHAKAAGVPVVVAVNKIDKDGATPERVRQELTEYEIVPEEWGGKNMFVDISAKKNLHIDDLLETILLQSDVLELKANPDALASGFVIEANLDKGRGPVATVLVNRGTLHPGDMVVAGTSYGKVRALVGPDGKQYKGVEPGEPAEILGLDSVPTAGDDFRVFEDEREARKLVESRRLRERVAEQSESHMSLDDLFDRIEEGKQTDLNLIIKADVQGSIEALRDALMKMDQSEVKINIVHSAVGGITETDVTLATASDAIIIGFNVRPTGKSRVLAEREKVDIRTYKVIYQAIEDINAARVGLLSPDIVEKDTGIIEVRETFKVPKIGVIAGAYVVEGEINRDDSVRVVRDGTVVHDGKIASLKRFKDDVKSVKEGYECGIGIDGFQDIKVGDTIEGYRVEEVERTE
ncbi:MAG: translation initiation factor IF-2 [Coriobacteriia bacterium]|nr:translation initiation factor IF-2 [Coriobacteriia bacterium]